MIAKLICLLLLVGIGYSFYDAYVIKPQMPVSGSTLKDSMQIALQYKAVGIRQPYVFIIDHMKDDMCFSNTDQKEFDVVCQECQTSGLLMQFLIGGLPQPEPEKASAEKPDLST